MAWLRLFNNRNASFAATNGLIQAANFDLREPLPQRAM